MLKKNTVTDLCKTTNKSSHLKKHLNKLKANTKSSFQLFFQILTYLYELLN